MFAASLPTCKYRNLLFFVYRSESTIIGNDRKLRRMTDNRNNGKPALRISHTRSISAEVFNLEQEKQFFFLYKSI